MSTIYGLRVYIYRHLGGLGLGLLFVIAANGAALLGPLVLGNAIDNLRRSGPHASLLLSGTLIVGVAIAQGILGFGARFWVNGVSRRIEYELRNAMFAHFQRLELAYFQHRKIGDLVARAINDLTAVRSLLGPGVSNLFNTTVGFVLTVVVMAHIDLRLTIYAGCVLPLISVVFVIIGRRIEHRFKEVQDQFGAISARAQENFSGIRAIKAYVREDSEIDAFNAVTSEYRRRSISYALISSLMWPAMAMVAGTAVVMLIWLGGNDVIDHRISIGQFVQFNAYISQLTWPMIALGWAFNLFQQGAASWQRVQEVLQFEPAISDGPALAPITSISGALEFRGVSFAYGSNQVLHDINLRVEVGQTVAIVGPTGAGKSTLVNLIPRVFEAQIGEVLVDGVDVRAIPLRLLRQAVGYVPQETFLFSEPLAENVAYGVETTDPERVRAAADIAQLSKDVEDFPRGYDTMVGERGVTLSGGQKQRTAIARAVLKDPKILILDDALSSVDTYTEEEILHRLRGVMARRTSLIISHRVSTVRDADLIVVMAAGRIVERGTHDQLLAAGGLYGAMYRRQLLAEELQVDESTLGRPLPDRPAAAPRDPEGVREVRT
jgi:ATP-binding cassette, subfamily B, multidrug efflux pump